MFWEDYKEDKIEIKVNDCTDYDPEIGFPIGNGKCKTCGNYHSNEFDKDIQTKK